MRVDTGIPRGPCQRLVLPIGDVLVRLGVTVLLAQSKVHNVEDVGFLAQAHEEIFWFDIAVDVAFIVQKLESRDQLVGYHDGGFEGHYAAADVE